MLDHFHLCIYGEEAPVGSVTALSITRDDNNSHGAHQLFLVATALLAKSKQTERMWRHISIKVFCAFAANVSTKQFPARNY